MDLKQIKDDLKEGKIVSKVTWMKLLEVAIRQDHSLTTILVLGDSMSQGVASDCKKAVKCI